MKYIKFELEDNKDGTYTPVYKDADDGTTQAQIQAQIEQNAQASVDESQKKG